MKIGVMFGNPETTTGGNALKFYASVRLDIRRIGAIKHGDEVVGSRTKVKVVKNKVAPPFREAEFDILYGTGISKEGELVDIGAELGIVEKSGAWYSFDGERIGQGRENTKEFLKENRETAEVIERRIREKCGLVTALEAAMAMERAGGVTDRRTRMELDTILGAGRFARGVRRSSQGRPSAHVPNPWAARSHGGGRRSSEARTWSASSAVCSTTTTAPSCANGSRPISPTPVPATAASASTSSTSAARSASRSA